MNDAIFSHGRLLAHYEKIADAPDAIARLRRFNLDLAVRGKLVPQDPNDEPASELLKRIAAEKARLVKAGESRKPSAIEPITHAEAPFALPSAWAWARVGDIFDYDAGAKRHPKELIQDRWLLELEDIEKSTSTVLERLRVSDRDSLSTKSEFEVGDILYGKLRPYLNKVVVADEPGYSTTEIVAIRPFLKLCPEYCALAFRRPDFVAYVERLGRGTKMPRLRTPDAIVAAFPLPPLAEQHRIVAKVNELMALCDRLEAARATREAARDRLTAASLARLNAPDPGSFQADARFALDALPALTTRPGQIKALRQTILNLAVRGKLVPQDPNDDAASELLKRIAKEKKRLLDERSIKPDHSLPAVSVEEAPFPVPPGWQWVRAQELSLKISDGVHKKPSYVPVGIPFITVKNLTEGDGISFRETKFITERDHLEFIKRTHPERGDVLITKDGTIGVARIVQDDRVFSIFVSVALVKMVLPAIAPFLTLCINSDGIRDTIIPKGAALKHLHLIDLRKLPLPLPPLAEQHCIVAKVDALMAICDRLEASLTDTAATRRRLLDALLAEALAPADARELEAAE
jgi:type I restriction enzyme S subunit